MSVEVRTAQGEDDFRALHALFVEYEDELPPRLRHGSVPKIPELQKLYEEPNAAFLAASDGIDVGCVAVTALDRETALMRHLFVTPRGRGRGAARSLVTRLVELVRSNGYRRVALDTDKEELNPAYLLYRALGFEECEPHGVVGYDSPTFMELLL